MKMKKFDVIKMKMVFDYKKYEKKNEFFFDRGKLTPKH